MGQSEEDCSLFKEAAEMTSFGGILLWRDSPMKDSQFDQELLRKIIVKVSHF